jgi:hypothetical protein
MSGNDVLVYLLLLGILSDLHWPKLPRARESARRVAVSGVVVPVRCTEPGVAHHSAHEPRAIMGDAGARGGGDQASDAGRSHRCQDA